MGAQLNSLICQCSILQGTSSRGVSMMFDYITKRIGQIILVLFVITIIVFLMMQFAGDPISNLLPPDAEPQQVEEMRVALGLDQPVYMQYLHFLKNALHGNLGISFYHQLPALGLVLERLPATLELAVVALIISIVIAIPAGVYVAVKPDSILSKGIMIGSLTGISLPTFLIGILLILFFSVNLSWLPSSGRGELVQILNVDTSLFNFRWMETYSYACYDFGFLYGCYVD